MNQEPIILGFDTSCDETSVAVLQGKKKLLSNVISSQIKLHAPFGGVVPELASRSHLENLETVLNAALTQAGVTLKDISGIAVTAMPGLIGCLLVGLSYAKSLAYSLKVPLTTVHHLKGHLFSPFLEHEETYPFLGLVVSGGHTALYYVENFDSITCLGETVDDAAGEAYDKVAKLLGLGFPGGPVIDKLARTGRADAFKFTRAKVKKGPYYFSFSGLKTAVSLVVKKELSIPSPLVGEGQGLASDFIKNLAASFQHEVVGSLLEKAEQALCEKSCKAFVIAGGVAANSLLRSQAQELALKFSIPCLIPSFKMCTDNGAMIAYVGAQQLAQGQYSPLSCNAFSSLPLAIQAP